MTIDRDNENSSFNSYHQSQYILKDATRLVKLRRFALARKHIRLLMTMKHAYPIPDHVIAGCIHLRADILFATDNARKAISLLLWHYNRSANDNSDANITIALVIELFAAYMRVSQYKAAYRMLRVIHASDLSPDDVLHLAAIVLQHVKQKNMRMVNPIVASVRELIVSSGLYTSQCKSDLVFIRRYYDAMLSGKR